MATENRSHNQGFVDRLIAVLLGLPWPKVVGEAWKTLRKIPQRRYYLSKEL